MSHDITVSQDGQSIVINHFTVTNADFISVVASESPESQGQAVLDVIAIGSAAMQRVRSTIDVDFVEKRFGTLTGVFEKTLNQLEKRANRCIIATLLTDRKWFVHQTNR